MILEASEIASLQRSSGSTIIEVNLEVPDVISRRALVNSSNVQLAWDELIIHVVDLYDILGNEGVKFQKSIHQLDRSSMASSRRGPGGSTIKRTWMQHAILPIDEDSLSFRKLLSIWLINWCTFLHFLNNPSPLRLLSPLTCKPGGRRFCRFLASSILNMPS